MSLTHFERSTLEVDLKGVRRPFVLERLSSRDNDLLRIDLKLRQGLLLGFWESEDLMAWLRSG